MHHLVLKALGHLGIYFDFPESVFLSNLSPTYRETAEEKQEDIE